MNILKEHKTFDNTTGEIKIDCQVLCDERTGNCAVIVNGSLVSVNETFIDAKDYYDKLLEMDKYIASTVPSYEVYVVLE